MPTPLLHWLKFSAARVKSIEHLATRPFIQPHCKHSYPDNLTFNSTLPLDGKLAISESI